MYFVINMDVDTDTKELGHVHHGRILDSVAFAKLVTHCEMVESVAFTTWDLAADYSEEYFPDYTPTIAPVKKESGTASRRRELGRRATATRRVC